MDPERRRIDVLRLSLLAFFLGLIAIVAALLLLPGITG